MGHPGHHLTLCPVCDGDLEALGFDDEKPLQTLEQECESSTCEFVVRQAVLWFPNDSFTVIAPNVDGDECGHWDCESEAVARLQHVEEQVTRYRCRTCLSLDQDAGWQRTEVLAR